MKKQKPSIDFNNTSNIKIQQKIMNKPFSYGTAIWGSFRQRSQFRKCSSMNNGKLCRWSQGIRYVEFCILGFFIATVGMKVTLPLCTFTPPESTLKKYFLTHLVPNKWISRKFKSLAGASLWAHAHPRSNLAMEFDSWFEKFWWKEVSQ